MTKNTKNHFSALAGLLLLATVATAQVNYQGRLTDAAGDPVPDASAFITFSLWDASVGGNKLWGDQVIIADLLDGRFNVILGPSDNNNPQRNLGDVFSISPGNKYLELKVGTDDPLPRQELLPSLTSLHAFRADDFNSTVLFKHEEPKTVEVRGTLDVNGALEVEDDAVVNVDGDVNVDGSVNMGPLAALSALGANSDMRIVTGTVTYNASNQSVSWVGTGFNVTKRNSTGGYSINFSPSFAEAPVVVATAHHTNDRPHIATVGISEPHRTIIYTWDGNGNPATSFTRVFRTKFFFIAIGPR
ncbi:MAG: hypothetical protein AB3N33_05860 [Puniceicoccaceae bacterium]